MSQAQLVADLALRPALGVRRVLEEGRLGWAAAAVVAACAIAAANVARLAATTSVEDLVYGPERLALVDHAIGTLGVTRTAVLVFVMERAWGAALVLTAAAPLFVWLLGATALHAAAVLAEARRQFRRFLVFFGYATALVLVPAGVASLLLEADPRSTAAALSRGIGAALLAWLAFLTYRAVREHYAVGPSRAVTIILIAVALFYVAPLLLIVAALASVVVAAILLEII